MFTSHLILNGPGGSIGGGGVVESLVTAKDSPLDALGDVRLWLLMLLVPVGYFILRRLMSEGKKS